MPNPPPPWHHLQPQEAVAQLESDAGQGLDEPGVRERLARHGENRLTERPPRSKWLVFADQFKSLLILVLVAAALLAGAI
ncbi:MAG: hypothetical protein EP309_05115, partial [Gammaproteobacteria bacterium]